MANGALMRDMQTFGLQPILGKVVIADHKRRFKSGPENASTGVFTVASKINGRLIPVALMLGNDYLKGNRYPGVDGKHYPLTVDAAIVHEIAHMVTGSTDEKWPVAIEGVIATAFGGVQRHHMTYLTQHIKRQTEYTTLYDKFLPTKPTAGNAVGKTKEHGPNEP